MGFKCGNDPMGTLTIHAEGGDLSFKVTFDGGGAGENKSVILDAALSQSWMKVPITLVLRDETVVDREPRHIYYDALSMFDCAYYIDPARDWWGVVGVER